MFKLCLKRVYHKHLSIDLDTVQSVVLQLYPIAKGFHIKHARHMLNRLYSMYIVRYKRVYLQIQSIEECRYRKVHHHQV